MSRRPRRNHSAEFKPESTEGRPWGQPLKKLEGAHCRIWEMVLDVKPADKEPRITQWMTLPVELDPTVSAVLFGDRDRAGWPMPVAMKVLHAKIALRLALPQRSSGSRLDLGGDCRAQGDDRPPTR